MLTESEQLSSDDGENSDKNEQTLMPNSDISADEESDDSDAC